MSLGHVIECGGNLYIDFYRQDPGQEDGFEVQMIALPAVPGEHIDQEVNRSR